LEVYHILQLVDKHLLKEDKLEASEGCKEKPSEGETHHSFTLSLSLFITGVTLLGFITVTVTLLGYQVQTGEVAK